MRNPATPPVVPYGADQTIYLIVDHCGTGSAVPVEREIERTDFDKVLADFMAGQFHDPVRVVAFNTLEHWSKDISIDVAREIQSRCDSDSCGLPPYLAGFLEIHLGLPHQLTRGGPERN